MQQNKTLRGVAIFLAVVAAAAILGTAAFFITSKLYKGKDDPVTTISTNAVAADAAAQTTDSVAETEVATDAAAPAVSAETVVDIFLENRDVWEMAVEGFSRSYAQYGFLDLDFDGVPELIIHHSEGSGRVSDNRYYRADIESRTVTRINGAEEDSDGYDLFYTNEELMPRLLKQRDTGELYYYCANLSRGGILYSSLAYGTLKADGDRLLCEVLFFEETDATGGEELHKYEIIRNGDRSEVEEWSYEQTQGDFFSQHEDMDLRYRTVVCSDYDDADETGKRDLLLGSCRAFQYNGFSIQ